MKTYKTCPIYANQKNHSKFEFTSDKIINETITHENVLYVVSRNNFILLSEDPFKNLMLIDPNGDQLFARQIEKPGQN